MRRLLRDVAAGEKLGGVTTVRDPTVGEEMTERVRRSGERVRRSGKRVRRSGKRG